MEYSIEVIKELEERFHAAALHRPMRIERYDAGTERIYDVTDVARANKGRVHLVIEKFVGGGFAGQVYRVRILDIRSQAEAFGALEVGKIYAMKILVPPTAFSRMFRNVVYRIGFQGPFQLQVNPAAAQAGALWQKLIRWGAKIRFGSESAVTDIHATFVDEKLCSCGELSEWIDGRVWRLEVDERMDLLKQWSKGGEVDPADLGSPEYRAKREFMLRFVQLLHDMGGYEFARQYEWWTCKSQPNCLKRNGSEGASFGGLVAVDFRAGLALLPFLPMSPGDLKLIASGIMRGSLVQFDRGDLGKLEAFVENHTHEYSDMRGMLKALKAAEHVYRHSLPDITRNHFRLFFQMRLWSAILDSAVTGWRVKNLVDDRWQRKFEGSRALTLLFYVLGIFPVMGCFLRKIWGRSDWRKHYWGMLTSWNYLRRSIRARVAEKVIIWHRSGRLDRAHAMSVATNVLPVWYHLPLSVLPVGLHRFLTDRAYAKDRLVYLAVRPVRLYFNTELREQWLVDMVTEGKKKELLTREDAEVILSQVKEPFIQKYLKSLAVHLCTLPVTQIVSLALAIAYVAMHPEMPRGQAWGIGIGIVALFQVTPISPGSLVRGLYVLYLVIRERNFEDYNIAVFLGFFKYVGYLAFPIQMGYRYPALARFMAAHWATEAVHAVPVFGERGALLEHGVFCLFYNWPMTLRRRMRKRSQVRTMMPPRYWHIALCIVAGLGIFGIQDSFYLDQFGELPGLTETCGLTVLVALLCGAAIALGAGGAALSKRIVGGAVCGSVLGALYTGMSAILDQAPIAFGDTATRFLWRALILTILTVVSVILTELKLPEPDVK